MNAILLLSFQTRVRELRPVVRHIFDYTNSKGRAISTEEWASTMEIMIEIWETLGSSMIMRKDYITVWVLSPQDETVQISLKKGQIAPDTDTSSRVEGNWSSLALGWSDHTCVFVWWRPSFQHWEIIFLSCFRVANAPQPWESSQVSPISPKTILPSKRAFYSSRSIIAAQKLKFSNKTTNTDWATRHVIHY